MTVELFIPCFIDQIYPETAQYTFNAGFWDEAKEVGSKFLGDFSENTYIVSPSASCVGMVKSYYNDLFTNTAVHNKCRNIQGHIYELSDFLVNVLKKDYFGAELEGKAVYHDSCAALRECKIKGEPRVLLSKVLGLELVEMADTETCCGFGGTFTVKFEGISSAMAQQKVNHALDVGAEYIISTDASCLMHLQSYIDANQMPLKTMHLADVLTHGWGNV
jgi:L-lactate dehydrogenase complex protein LldE